MILEVFLVLAVLGILTVLFYKQAVQEFRILQTESFEKAMPLLHERCPVVIMPAPEPKDLWTHTGIASRPTLLRSKFAGKMLGDALKRETVFFKPSMAEILATQTGIPVWAAKTLLPSYTRSVWWGPLFSCRSEVMIGAQGLRQTIAYSTIILATDGALSVSLVNQASDAYLPKKWQGKRLSKMTRDDAPLLKQIEYIDIVLRPGSALIVPPHWKVCWESHEKSAKEPPLSAWIEIHHPVSRLAHSAESR
jgi:hypothetical protein